MYLLSLRQSRIQYCINDHRLFWHGNLFFSFFFEISRQKVYFLFIFYIQQTKKQDKQDYVQKRKKNERVIRYSAWYQFKL